MLSLVKFLYANPDRGLFNQIAMFSLAGLSLSIALVLTCNLQMPVEWL